ncbi:MAG: ribonuclease P protein component [Candidatus Nomurabacteria bacterium]|nr:ribonuclease P protein component [Candidatus Nomurabacteria bacterium]
MPPKELRLSRADFSKLKERATLRSPLFDITYSLSKSLKVACVIAKKRVKLAVDRNKIRRKTYHAFKETGFNKNYIIIIYPRIEMSKCPYKEIVMELSKILATIK